MIKVCHVDRLSYALHVISHHRRSQILVIMGPQSGINFTKDGIGVA